MPSLLSKLRLHRNHDHHKLETARRYQHAEQGCDAASSLDASTSRTTETKVSFNTAASSSNPSEQLWNTAYDQLKQKEPKLVDAYETILSQPFRGDSLDHHPLNQQNSIEQTNVSKRRSQMDKLIQIGLARTEKEAKAKQSVGEVMQMVLSVKDVVSSAVQAMPQAALAWTGVCFALQIFTNPTTESKTNRDGLDHVIERMKWYDELSHPLLKHNTENDGLFTGMHRQLESRVIRLYQELLLYLIKSVCSYYRNRFLSFLRDTVKLDGWNGSLKIIQDAEKAFQLDSSAYNTQKNTANMEVLTKIAISTEDNDCLRHLHVSDPRDDKKRIEQTKGGLLQDSYRWVLDNEDFQRWRTDDQSRLLWIKGDPGKGKTMLLCGIIDEIQGEGSSTEPLSYFFCQATDSRINTATAVLRGLIYLLIKQCPSLILHVRARYDQAGRSLFEDTNAWVALSDIFANMTQDPKGENAYLIVDALDECMIKLPNLLDLIVRSLSSSSHLKWIVSSRNWPDIEEGLQGQNKKATLSLELNVKSVSEAVNKYVEHKVNHLTQTKRYDDSIKTSVQEYLLSNANGTFLWVAMVCQNLASTSTRNTLATLKTYPPGLNPLYQRMMQLICDSEDSELLKQIIALTAVVYRPITLGELTSLMHVSDSFADNPIWLEELVKQCGSFLIIRESTVYFIHQSANDFVLKNASDKIFPSGEVKKVHYDVWSKSMKEMSALKRDIYSLQEPSTSRAVVKIPEEDPLKRLRYSCVYFIDHLLAVDKCFEEVRGCDEEVQKFFKKHFLHWLETLSLMGSIEDGIKAINKLLIQLQKMPTRSPLLALVEDMRRFALLNKDVVEAFPLQTYISALIFCPVGSVTRQLFKNDEPEWITLKPNVEEGWSSCLQTLEGHSDSVSSVAFSHDGQKIVSGSWDKTVRIWDAATGSLQQTLEGHLDSVNSVAFSHDGQKIVSGSRDKTVRIWDAATGSLLQTLEGHSNYVYSVAFSPDGQKIVSGSDDETVRVWDTATGSLLQTLEGHWDAVYSVAFSPDGQKIVSGSRDRTVRTWDTATATGSLQQTLEGHSDPVNSVAFSHDGQKIVSGSRDKTVRIWDTATGSLQQTLEGHSNYVSSVAFSRDGQKIVSGSWDKTVRIWDATTGSLQQTLEGHSDFVNSVAFSRDGQKIVSGSWDKTVRIWDTATGSLQQTLEGHSDSVNSVAFSHDGQKIVSGSRDRTVRTWDTATATGSLQQTLESHPGSVNSIATSLGSCPEPILINHHWVTINGRKALWLPYSRRHICFDFLGNGLVIGSASGVVTIVRFDLSKF